MASFVREVLSATGRLGEKDDFQAKATKLRSRVDDLKSDLCERINSRYSDFSASFSEVSMAVAELESVLNEVEMLENSIRSHLKPGVIEAEKDIADVTKQLNELSRSVLVANDIKLAFTSIEEANDLLDRHEYMGASSKLTAIEQILKRIENCDDDEDASKAQDSLSEEFHTIKNKISFTLDKDWDENIKIEPIFNDPENEESLESVNIVLAYMNDVSKFETLARAMAASDVLAFRQQKFAKNIVNLVVKSVLEFQSTLESSNATSITLKFDKSKTPDPMTVLDNLNTIFLIIGKAFDVTLEDGGAPLLSMIGSQIGQEVVSLIVQDCLMPAVPESKSKLEEFSETVAKSSKDLNEALVKLQFLHSGSEQKIREFTRNVEATFTNKRCKTILAKARLLMKQHLHNTTILDVDDREALEDSIRTATNTVDLKIDLNLEEELLPLPEGMSLNDGLFNFPKCQVSLSAIEIVKLAKATIKEALDASGSDAAFYTCRLLVTARNIFEMYNDVLPVFHSESLKTMPLNAAVGYNNCMYLAHECLQIYIPADRVPEPLNERPLTFADLVSRLRRTGVEVFLGQMRTQRDNMRSMLRDSTTGFGQLNGESLLPPSSEKCLKQVYHQLKHLKNLWQDVLPLSIYRRSMGTILNTVVEELVQKVIILEDIAADAAVQICMLYTFLQENAPDLFCVEAHKSETSKADVIRYVSKWNRFKELILLLNASLREIEDRWSDGKGPLANEFAPEDVKRLIRALFQNTDRRAGVLSRIKY